MAFGFAPKSKQEFSLDNLSAEKYIAIATEAAKRLGWNLGYVSEAGFVAYTKFSFASWSEEVTLKIEYGRVFIKSECMGTQMMDWGKNRKNIEKLVFCIEELMLGMADEEIENRIGELKNSIVPKEEDILSQSPSTGTEKIKSFLSVFTPTEGYFITPIIINFNVIVFIIMMLSGVSILLPDIESLINWGANFRPMTLSGQWWRLITACFLHIGILHLLMNMYALLYIGLMLEPYLGKVKFVSAYLLTGLIASLVSVCWHPLTVSAGASGAIFGMYGVFLALLTTSLIEKEARKALLTSIGIFVVFNLINGLKGGVDNAAHIGGLLSGLIIGYAFVPGLKAPETGKRQLMVIGLLTTLSILSTIIALKQLPNNIERYESNEVKPAEIGGQNSNDFEQISNDIGQYESKMKEFIIMEKMALEFYGMSASSPKEEILFSLNDRGIYYWNENINIINEIEQLDLPSPLHDNNRLLKEYCEIRIKSYELLSKEVNEGQGKYQKQIKSYDRQIENIKHKLTEQEKSKQLKKDN